MDGVFGVAPCVTVLLWPLWASIPTCTWCSDDFGQIGRSYREVDENEADRQTVIRNLKDGQYANPVRIVCFNTAQGTSRDVTEEIAREIKEQGGEFSPGLRDFLDYLVPA